jgi:D-alanyl-D-alanine carboxypeptidase
MKGDVFDDRQTMAFMQHQTWTRFGFPRDRASLRLPGWPIEYGRGMMRFQDPVYSTLLRIGSLGRAAPLPELVGHAGSTGSWLFWCPPLDLMFGGTVDQAHAGGLPFRFLCKLLGDIGKGI